MRVFKKKNEEYTKAEKVVTAIFAFIAFGIIGALLRLFGEPIQLDGGWSMLMQFGPHILGVGGIPAALAYLFPKPFNIIMCFLPVPGISS